MNSSNKYRSIFWPVLLIGFGVIWLMINLGLLPSWSWGGLWRLWPLFLIALGLDLLFARRSALIGGLVALVTLGLIVAVILGGGLLGAGANRAEVITEVFSEPINEADSAEIVLDLSVGPATVYALDDEDMLFDAEVTHVGEIEFTVSGDRVKKLRLDEQQTNIETDWFDFIDRDNLKWDIGITPFIPINLEVIGGVGEAELDLSEHLLEALVFDVGVGDLQLRLPGGEGSYQVRIDGGVGKTDVEIQRGANLTLDIDGSVGDVTVDVPSNAEVRVDASVGVGNIRLPSNFERLSGSDDGVVGESGIWQTPGYEQAESRIEITFDGGVGDFRIR